jgi:Fic family protein
MAQTYIWQQPDWPSFRHDAEAWARPLAAARLEQGKALGRLEEIGLAESVSVERQIWTDEAVATAAIEGEKLDLETVRSSVMRRLGEEGAGQRVDRNVDGLLDVMQDALRSYKEELDDDRLHRWQAALFPAGTSGVTRIAIGRYREHGDPMQIVSGPIGREKVHYEAPSSAAIPNEMGRFLARWNDTRSRLKSGVDGIIRAAIAHLWFETIHPFEDGNGRIGRALIDAALAQDADSPQRYCSISRQLLANRNAYYDALNAAQRGSLDVTSWVLFFIEQFRSACVASQEIVQAASEKTRFWARHHDVELNERQRKALQRMLDAGNDGFEGGMSAEKYGHLTSVSKATATRDLTDLLNAGLLVTSGKLKSTRYWLSIPGWATGLGSLVPRVPD